MWKISILKIKTLKWRSWYNYETFRERSSCDDREGCSSFEDAFSDVIRQHNFDAWRNTEIASDGAKRRICTWKLAKSDAFSYIWFFVQYFQASLRQAPPQLPLIELLDSVDWHNDMKNFWSTRCMGSYLQVTFNYQIFIAAWTRKKTPQNNMPTR